MYDDLTITTDVYRECNVKNWLNLTECVYVHIGKEKSNNIGGLQCRVS